MAKEFYFSGKTKWCFPFTLNQYDKYSLCFYPANDQVRRELKATGIRNELNEDDDGFFYRLAKPQKSGKTARDMRDGPIEVVDAAGKPVDEVMIGNGSEITIRLMVEEFQSKQHGTVVRSWVDKIRLDKLIPYVKPDVEAEADGAFPF